jgi:hypothetical protein
MMQKAVADRIHTLVVLQLWLRTNLEYAWPLKFSVPCQPDIPCANHQV